MGGGAFPVYVANRGFLAVHVMEGFADEFAGDYLLLVLGEFFELHPVYSQKLYVHAFFEGLEAGSENTF